MTEIFDFLLIPGFTWADMGQLMLVFIPVMVYLWFWTSFDLKNKRNMTLYDKDGKKLSNFGDWLDGKEK